MHLTAYGYNSSVRYLVARSNGTFEWASRTLMCHLMEDEPPLYLPEFAGMRLRYVEAILEISDLQNPEIIRLSYGTVAINRVGRVDYPVNAAARRARLTQAFGLEPEEAMGQGNVIFAQEAFTLAGASWQPTPAQQQQILAIFTNEVRAKRFRPAKLNPQEAVPAFETAAE